MTATYRSLAVALLLGATLAGSALANPLYRVTNVSPSPALTNEFYLTATNTVTSIGGTNVHVLVYKDDPPAGGGAPMELPGPLIELTVGQTVICHFKNALTNNVEGASIHWHGIELDNDSDGTAISQDSIFNGQTYTYRFVVTRPGLFWYHSHMLPGTTTFGGMYGPILVHDTNETALIAANVLPPTNRTFQIVMTDVSFTNGVIGKIFNGTNTTLNTLIQYCENQVLGVPPNPGGACGVAGPPGDLFLCNGSIPVRAGTFCAPTAASSPVFYIGNHQRVRLQLFNESISRNAFLTLRYPCSNPGGDTNLYHIGGQGGLLDNAVKDGGVHGSYDFHYPLGTVNLGSGAREDVMFYSSGNNGDVIQLVGNPLTSGTWNLSGGFKTNYPVAFFVVTNGGSTNLPLAAGSPILSAIGAAQENLRLLNTNNVAPPPIPADGNYSGYIELKNDTPANGASTGPNIGGYAATALDGNSGYGSWPDVPHPPSAVWARAGDVLQLAIANNTGPSGGGGGTSTHPYHLHGFSMQPMAIYSANLQTNLYTIPYNDFVDTIDVQPGEALVFRIKLSDRPRLADTATGGPLTLASSAPTGGNLGRWLMHCHIFLHATVGMISELVVVPNTAHRLVGHLAGTNSVILVSNPNTTWVSTSDAPWLHIVPGYTSGTDSSVVLFTYDANPGPTRFGTLNVGGETVEVTQAGTNYIQAPGPLTTLASSSISGPVGIATDSDGNVYFADGNNHAIKRWNVDANNVTTLVSGLGNPQGLALDNVGNVYFADFNSTAVKRWNASTHTVSTLFNNNSTGVSGLAVDSAGNVYISVPGQHSVKEWNASTGTLTTFLTNGLSGPYGVAVDPAGRIYVADTVDNSVKRLDWFSFFGGRLFFWNTLVSSNDLSSPWNLAVDDGGNVYIGDGGHNAVKRWSYASNNVVSVIATGLADPTGVAVDSVGNVFVSDFVHNAIKEMPYAYVDPTPKHEGAESAADSLATVLLPTENLLTPFAPTPGPFWIGYNGSVNGVVNFSVGANLGGPRSGTLTVLGQPITINQDGASSGVAITNLLVGPAAGTNTVSEWVIPSIALWGASTATPWLHLPFASGTGSGNVLFTYDANPGPTRVGTLTINTKTVTVTQAGATYVQAPGPLTTLVGTGLSSPVDVALDAAGNVFFSDSGNNTIKKWTPGSLTASTVVSSGLSIPQGLGLDPFGNIFVSDYSSQTIKEWRAADSTLQSVVDTSPYSPAGLSLGYGTNVYWAQPTGHSIHEWISSSDTTFSLLSSGITGPFGVDLDVGGAIYIADTSANAIKKYTPSTGILNTLATAGISTPWNVGVDGSGNVYVANGGANNIVKWVAANGNLVTVVPSGVNDPTCVKADANQNLFIADFGNGAIKELPYAFVDPTTRFEPAGAGSDVLPVVLPPAQNLSAQFAPTAADPWVTITGTTGGVVSFNYTANPSNLARATTILLLGQSILVQQAPTIFPPVVVNASMPTNGVFQFTFTNTTRGASYSVVTSTNLLTPLAAWPLIGPATQIGPDLWQFIDNSASNQARFYRIRSP